MRLSRQQPGVVLVLAILIIGTVLAGAVSFAALIVHDIQQSRLVDQSIQAYYISESGAERALYQTRRKNAVSDCNQVVSGSACQQTVGSGYGYCSLTSNQVPCITSSKGSLTVNGDWAVAVANELNMTVPLNVGESFQVDLFSPYQLQNSSGQSQVQSFQIISNKSTATQLYGEITNLSWLLNGTTNCPLNPSLPALAAISKGQIILNQATPYSTTGPIHNFNGTIPDNNNPEINPACSYILRVSNILPGADQRTFTLSVYQSADTSQQISIPSRLLINSSAIFGNSYQNIQVKTPIRSPLSGLYDFVLFSEQPVNKQ